MVRPQVPLVYQQKKMDTPREMSQNSTGTLYCTYADTYNT